MSLIITSLVLCALQASSCRLHVKSAGSCDADACMPGCSDAEAKGHSDGDEDEGDDVWATMEPVGDTESSRQPVKKSKWRDCVYVCAVDVGEAAADTMCTVEQLMFYSVGCAKLSNLCCSLWESQSRSFGCVALCSRMLLVSVPLF